MYIAAPSLKEILLILIILTLSTQNYVSVETDSDCKECIKNSKPTLKFFNVLCGTNLDICWTNTIEAVGYAASFTISLT